MDRNPTNNDPDNLAVLCLPHHDEYDSKRSQSKGLTEGELKKHRGNLYEIVAKKDSELRFPNPLYAEGDTNDGTSKFVLASAKILGQLLEAYDAEKFRLEHSNIPTGNMILQLGQVAVDAGEFDAALEALVMLLRLACDHYDSGAFRYKGLNKLPAANAFTAAIRLLERFIVEDIGFFERSVKRMQLYAMIQDQPMPQLREYKEMPRGSFDVVFTILWHVLRDVVAWMDEEGSFPAREAMYTARMDKTALSASVSRTITKSLADLLMGLGVLISSNGTPFPASLHLPRIVGTDRLGTSFDTDEPPAVSDEEAMIRERLRNLAQACLLVLDLPEAEYKQLLSNLEYRLAAIIGTSTVRKAKTDTLQQGIDAVRGRAVVPGHHTVVITTSSDSDRDQIQAAYRDALAQGQAIAQTLKGLLLKQRPIT
ncbi:MAG: hypothetical protein IVW55_04045 [Chloroflexi bacterium]|nr:hypothetical protein [Chloroflexota bacterium]